MKKLAEVHVQFRSTESVAHGDEVLIADELHVSNGMIAFSLGNCEWSYPLDVIFKITTRAFEEED